MTDPEEKVYQLRADLSLPDSSVATVLLISNLARVVSIVDEFTLVEYFFTNDPYALYLLQPRAY